MPVRKILCGNSQLSVYHFLDALGYYETCKWLWKIAEPVRL